VILRIPGAADQEWTTWFNDETARVKRLIGSGAETVKVYVLRSYSPQYYLSDSPFGWVLRE
jgi:hypothetical protein